MTRSIAAVLGVALVLAARPAGAQTISLTPIDPAVWDASVTVGWLGGDKSQIAERWNDWYDTFATSLDVGRYWTPHLKTEVGATFTTGGTVYSQQQAIVPGLRAPVFFTREHRFSLRALNLSASWQAFENAWVHPFVGAGVQVGWEQERADNVPSSREVTPHLPPAGTPGTAFDARPFLSGGAKLYVHERGFIRTDLTTVFDRRGASRVSWRIGAGVDF